MSTQGRRASLDDALTSLAAQTDRDFEVLLAVHAAPDDVARVCGAVDRYAPGFRAQIRVLTVEGDSRSSGLNLGLQEARGRYAAFLDDDDVVTANWIETFRAAHEDAPGTVLRAQGAVQEHRRTDGASIEYEPVSGFSAEYSREFSHLEHRWINQTPICCWAVPMGAVRALRLRFDEDLPVMEDWDFLIRAAELLGVTNREEFTSVYRRFMDGWGSARTIEPAVWDATARLIRARLDGRPMLLPAGSIERVVGFRETVVGLRETELRLSAAHSAAVARVEALERSRYWRATAPLRWLTSKRGHSLSRLKSRIRSLRPGARS